jgi:6-phosphogluconolactonase (cycloisomerase 2 family)
LGHTTEKTPRSFEIDPDGRYVFGAGEGSGKLAVFQVDELPAVVRIDARAERMEWVDSGLYP